MSVYTTEIDPQTENKSMVTKEEQEEGRDRSMGLIDTNHFGKIIALLKFLNHVYESDCFSVHIIKYFNTWPDK